MPPKPTSGAVSQRHPSDSKPKPGKHKADEEEAVEPVTDEGPHFAAHHVAAAQDLVSKQLHQKSHRPTRPGTAEDRRVLGIVSLPRTPGSYELHQESLPELPRLSVRDCLTNYLEHAAAVVPKQHLAHTRELVDQMCASASDWQPTPASKALPWYEAQLVEERLEQRQSLWLSANPGVVLRMEPRPDRNSMVPRAARLIHALLSFKAQMDCPEPPLERTGKVSLSMHAYRGLFAHCRTPHTSRDYASTYHRTSHVVVSHGGRWWRFDALHELDGSPLTSCEIEDNLSAIVAGECTPSYIASAAAAGLTAPPTERTPRTSRTDNSAPSSVVETPPPTDRPAFVEVPEEPAVPLLQMKDGLQAACDTAFPADVGALTYQHREHWAKVRATLIQDEINASAIHAVESAIFIVVLASQLAPEPDSVAALHAVSCGETTGDRWADKSLTLTVCANGVAGLYGEAVGHDHGHLLRLANHIFTVSTSDETVDREREQRRERAAQRAAAWQAWQREEERRLEAERLRELELQKERDKEVELERQRKSKKKATTSGTVVKPGTAERKSQENFEIDLAPLRRTTVPPLQLSKPPVDDEYSAAPTVIEWNSTQQFRAHVANAVAYSTRLLRRTKVSTVDVDFGARHLRPHSVHPESFVQLALQLAYFIAHKGPCVTVHSVNTAHFRAGRHCYFTPTVTPLSVAFCRTWTGAAGPVPAAQELRKLFVQAAAQQTALRDRAARGECWYMQLRCLDGALQRTAYLTALQEKQSAAFEQEQQMDRDRIKYRETLWSQRIKAERILEEAERQLEAEDSDKKSRRLAKKSSKPAITKSPRTFSGGLGPEDEELFADFSAPTAQSPRTPRDLSKQQLGVSPHPVFADDTFQTLNSPVLVAIMANAADASSTVFTGPSVVHHGIMASCIQDHSSTRFFLCSGDSQLDDFAAILHEVMRALFLHCLNKGLAVNPPKVGATSTVVLTPFKRQVCGTLRVV